MKKTFLLLLMAFVLHSAHAQFTYKVHADSVLLTGGAHAVELNLENGTKHVNGFLYNKGNGRTEFRKVIKLNDSTFIFGGDTLVIGGSAAWSLKGNSGTDALTNFLGTTDSQALVMRTKNLERMRISAKGFVGIGTNTPASFLHIVDTTHSNNPPLNVWVNANGFPHFRFTNINPGIYAGAGALYENNNNEFLQYFMGSSASSFAPSRVMIRSTGANGMKITTDKGLIQFQVGTVRALLLGDTANVKMEIDSFGVRLKQADLVTYDTAAYQTMVIDRSNGRLFKANSTMAGTGWSLNGNAGTNPANNFLGTIDSQDVTIRTNNTERVRVSAAGNVGIGTSTPNKKLHVIGQGLFSDTITAQKNVSVTGNIDVTQGVLNMTGTGISPFINITGNQNGWPRIVITNTANTTSAGAGSLYLNNAGHMLQQYMGGSINAFNPAGALIRSNGPGGMTIVADSGVIAFGKDPHTGISEFARFLTNGNLGLGTQTPAYKLDVNGKLGVRTMDSTASAANVLYQDAATGEIKKAALPVKQSFAQTATSTINGIDDETSLIAAGTGNLTIPAAAWFAGKTFRIIVKGFYSIDANNPAGISFKIKLGSTVIAQSTGTYLGGNKIDIPYEVVVDMTCRATGASGSLFAMGTFNTGDQHLNNINNGKNAAAINLSNDQTLSITAKLSDAAAGNSISAFIILLEAVN